MFKQNKEIFSFRKYKNGRTDSAKIGSLLLPLSLLIMFGSVETKATEVNSNAAITQIAEDTKLEVDANTRVAKAYNGEISWRANVTLGGINQQSSNLKLRYTVISEKGEIVEDIVRSNNFITEENSQYVRTFSFNNMVSGVKFSIPVVFRAKLHESTTGKILFEVLDGDNVLKSEKVDYEFTVPTLEPLDINFVSSSMGLKDNVPIAGRTTKDSNIVRGLAYLTYNVTVPQSTLKHFEEMPKLRYKVRFINKDTKQEIYSETRLVHDSSPITFRYNSSKADSIDYEIEYINTSQNLKVEKNHPITFLDDYIIQEEPNTTNTTGPDKEISSGIYTNLYPYTDYDVILNEDENKRELKTANIIKNSPLKAQQTISVSLYEEHKLKDGPVSIDIHPPKNEINNTKLSNFSFLSMNTSFYNALLYGNSLDIYKVTNGEEILLKKYTNENFPKNQVNRIAISNQVYDPRYMDYEKKDIIEALLEEDSFIRIKFNYENGRSPIFRVKWNSDYTLNEDNKGDLLYNNGEHNNTYTSKVIFSNDSYNVKSKEVNTNKIGYNFKKMFQNVSSFKDKGVYGNNYYPEFEVYNISSFIAVDENARIVYALPEGTPFNHKQSPNLTKKETINGYDLYYFKTFEYNSRIRLTDEFVLSGKINGLTAEVPVYLGFVGVNDNNLGFIERSTPYIDRNKIELKDHFDLDKDGNFGEDITDNTMAFTNKSTITVLLPEQLYIFDKTSVNGSTPMFVTREAEPGKDVKINTTVFNGTTIPYKNVSVITELPYANDKNFDGTKNRESEFTPVLKELVTPPKGWTVEYTTDDTKSKKGNELVNWTSNPTDLSKVTAIKYKIPEIQPSEKFELSYLLTVPEDATSGSKFITTAAISINDSNVYLEGHKSTTYIKESFGSVVVKYEDINGNEIKSKETVKPENTPTSTDYNTEPFKELTISHNNQVYEFVKLKENSSKEIDKVKPGESVVTYVYQLKTQETKDGDLVNSKTGSVEVEFVDENGTKIKPNVLHKDNVTVETSQKFVTKSGDTKISERTEITPINVPYNTRELATPTITAEDGKVYQFVKHFSGKEDGSVPEGSTKVVYQYKLKTDEVKEGNLEISKVGSIEVQYVDINGNTIKDPVLDEDNKTIETSQKFVTKSGDTKISERTEITSIQANYDTKDNKPDTIVAPDGKVYTFSKLKAGNETGQITEGKQIVVYEYSLSSQEIPNGPATDSKFGSVIVNFVDENNKEISKQVNFKDNIAIEKSQELVTKSGTHTISSRIVTTPITVNYNTKEIFKNTITTEDGTVYEFVKLLSGAEEGTVKEGTHEVIYQYKVRKENKIPKDNIPTVNIPEGQIGVPNLPNQTPPTVEEKPEADIPNITEVPKTDIPSVELPEADIPEISTNVPNEGIPYPTLDLPEGQIGVPNLPNQTPPTVEEKPKLDIPNITEVPKTNIPSVDLPEAEIPEISTSIPNEGVPFPTVDLPEGKIDEPKLEIPVENTPIENKQTQPPVQETPKVVEVKETPDTSATTSIFGLISSISGLSLLGTIKKKKDK